MEQSEIDALLKNGSMAESPDNPKKSDDELQWDDVQNELEQSQSPKSPIETREVSAASFEEIQKGEIPKSTLDLDFILDIPLFLTVELGRNRMLISELLQLGQGSVVELTKLAGEPMDVYVNQRLIARGEVVVVNEKFGVRLTDIVSPAERINKLK
ncbi:MAG: flagellar motor switch protein FliN [Deltaproteobacteria bacterium]|nr:flagellar motor switch protein FliN [Deltaproteobacteria bacterium]